MGEKCLEVVVSTRSLEDLVSWLHTLYDLLSTVHFGNLLFQKLVSFLADGHDLLASSAECGHSLQDFERDLSSILVFCESIWVVEGVIYLFPMLALILHDCRVCRGGVVEESSFLLRDSGVNSPPRSVWMVGNSAGKGTYQSPRSPSSRP